MKKKIKYAVNGKMIEREYNYIPVRYILAVFLTIIEVLAIISILIALCCFVPYFYLAVYLTEIYCVIRIIASNDNPEYKVPWLLFVLILPIAGFMLYFLFYSRKLSPKYIKRLNKLESHTYKKEDSVYFDQLEKESPASCMQAKLLCNISKSHLFSNTKQTYYPLGEEMWQSILHDLKEAQKFIYMEYFIIEEGIFWDSILNLLKEKASNGLDVRLIYDDIGCMSTLPGNYAKILQTYNIKATPFSRLKGQADGEFNNRSHRKITVIDGMIGYTGGVNIADEYINKTERFGHWKDIAIRLEGEAVWELTRLFLFDFGVNVKELPLPTPKIEYPKNNVTENGYLIPFGDGPYPLYKHRVGQTLIKDMLSSATKYAWIMTPYLIIDNDLCVAFENAALKGVDVRIIVPHIPDKKIVFEMTKAYYTRLMKSGVKIFEYAPGFIHAKCYLIDDHTAMIGTINLDYRSLVHHFENGVWLYNTSCIKEIKSDMEATFKKSIFITNEDTKANVIQKLLRSIIRIFAPLL